MKIFKYQLEERNGKYYTSMPSQSQIIRTDYVDDGYYKGHFVWAIVNPEHENVEREVSFKPSSTYNISFPMLKKEQLGVLEKQEIQIPADSNVVGVFDRSGKLYARLSGGLIFDKLKTVKICFYKTGQEITENVSNLKYIGWCRLFIKQELALYAFVQTNT